jgi:hypothetical protein
MGWHDGQLVIAIWPACSTDARGAWSPLAYPLAWHVVDASTAARQVTVGGSHCVPSYWASPAGLTCFDFLDALVRIYDWTGKQTAAIPVSGNAGYGLDLSPSGKQIFFISDQGNTFVSITTPSSPWSMGGNEGCMWIDDDHVLAVGGVLDARTKSETSTRSNAWCAGRFPGGL